MTAGAVTPRTAMSRQPPNAQHFLRIEIATKQAYLRTVFAAQLAKRTYAR